MAIEELQELKRLALTATDSKEWSFQERAGEIVFRVKSGMQAIFKLGRMHDSLNREVRANAAFIAAATPAAILALIAQLEQASAKEAPAVVDGELLVTMTISIDRDQNVVSDVQTHDNSFNEVLTGFKAIRGEIDRIFTNIKNCPHFPKTPEEARAKIVRNNNQECARKAGAGQAVDEAAFDQVMRQRDHAEDIIDQLCDAVLGVLRAEWSNNYGFEDAVADVLDRMHALTAAPAAVAQEPVAHLRYRCGQQWSGNGNHDIQHGEWLEVCEQDEKSDGGAPAFPVFAAPPAAQAGDALREAVKPVLAWWLMVRAQADLGESSLKPSDVVLHFMGSGASTMVTVGQLDALDAAMKEKP